MATVYKYPQWLMPENSNQSKVSNYSFEFDGVDDHISLPDIPFLRGGGQHFSISAWVYTTHITQAGFFGSRVAPSSTNTINFYRNTNRGASFLIKNSSTGDIEIRSSNDSLTTDNWHHVVATFDGTQTDAADRVNIYVDGVLDNSYQNGTGTNLPSGSTGIYNFIGRTYGGLKQTGKIDNLAIWDSTLTAGNVTTLYNSGEPVDITTLSPVAGWKLGEAANFTDNWLVNNSVLDNYSTRSFAFDGVDDILIGPNANLASAYTKASWSFWFNASSLPVSWASICSRRGSNDNHGELFGIDSTGKLVGNIGQSNALDGDYTGGTTISTGTWYNVVITYDGSGSTNDDKVKVYLNGSLETLSWTGTVQTELLQSVGAGRKYAIGGASTGHKLFNGKVDEVAIWYDTTLTPTNASTIYNSGTPADLSSLSPNFMNIRMGENATFSTNWTVPDIVNSPTNDFTSANMALADLEGEAPNYTGGGLSANMTIEDRVGEAPNSNNNAVSYNMDEADRETDVPS